MDECKEMRELISSVGLAEFIQTVELIQNPSTNATGIHVQLHAELAHDIICAIKHDFHLKHSMEVFISYPGMQWILDEPSESVTNPES